MPHGARDYPIIQITLKEQGVTTLFDSNLLGLRVKPVHVRVSIVNNHPPTKARGASEHNSAKRRDQFERWLQLY